MTGYDIIPQYIYRSMIVLISQLHYLLLKQIRNKFLNQYMKKNYHIFISISKTADIYICHTHERHIRKGEVH